MFFLQCVRTYEDENCAEDYEKNSEKVERSMNLKRKIFDCNLFAYFNLPKTKFEGRRLFLTNDRADDAPRRRR